MNYIAATERLNDYSELFRAELKSRKKFHVYKGIRAKSYFNRWVIDQLDRAILYDIELYHWWGLERIKEVVSHNQG